MSTRNFNLLTLKTELKVPTGVVIGFSKHKVHLRDRKLEGVFLRRREKNIIGSQYFVLPLSAVYKSSVRTQE